MTRKTLLAIALCVVTLVSCHHRSDMGAEQEAQEPTREQQVLQEQGWTMIALENQDFPEKYGVKPIMGLQDNYFDIIIGKGFDVAIKIVSCETNQPVRYVYVKENSTYTTSQIPQGKYYLKIAYGSDWMEPQDSVEIGRFTRNAFYEKSKDVFDFGKKNQQQVVNYELKLNVQDGTALNNFKTQPINAAEFFE